jgi:hypothetical protein
VHGAVLLSVTPGALRGDVRIGEHRITGVVTAGSCP